MNPEQFDSFDLYIQSLVSQFIKKEDTSLIEEEKVESMEGDRDRSDCPPLTPRMAVSRPIAVVCPESEVNTPLFSSVTRKDLFDGVELDASILETIISGIPLRDDSDSENELELLEEDSESEDDCVEVFQVDSDSENEENEITVRGYQVESVD